MDDPRIVVVANVLADHGTVSSSWALAKAQDVVRALDDLHNHDQRGQMGWDDETDPDEEDQP